MSDATPSSNPMKAIRAKCLDCMCDQVNEVKLCPSESCPLYPFRMGKNPFRAKKVLSEEKKAALTELLKKANAARNADTSAKETCVASPNAVPVEGDSIHGSAIPSQKNTKSDQI